MTSDAAERNHRPMSDLNTTPLIDVMLVLLIMFIITMPIATHAVKVDVPRPDSSIIIDPVKNTIGIDARGGVSWNGQPVDRTGLRARLASVGNMLLQPQLLFDPDAEARYEIVDSVMADIKRSGANKLAFVNGDRYRTF